MPVDGVQSCRHEDILSFEEITQFVRQLQASFDIRKLRLTGGDPLARRGIVNLVAMLSDLGIPDLGLTTNAQLLAGMASELRAAGLDRVNISLDSIDPDTFRAITRGGAMERTVAGIDAALRSGLRPVKLNMVVMRGINDREVAGMLSFALVRGCELRFLELMPIGYGVDMFESTYVPTDAVREMLSAEFALEPLPHAAGSSARRYRACRADGLDGVVGFVSPSSKPFCGNCTRLRITARGHLIGCLARHDGIPVRPLLTAGNDDALAAAVRCAMQTKRSDDHFEQSTAMAVIGG